MNSIGRILLAAAAAALGGLWFQGAPRAQSQTEAVSWVVYAAENAGGTDLYWGRSDGGAAVALTDTPVREDLPRFSPDGQRLAFLEGLGEVSALVVMDARGRNRLRLSPDTVTVRDLAWSPDGQQLAFTAAPTAGGKLRVYTAAADGSGSLQAHSAENEACWQPVWSPRGDQLAATCAPFGPSETPYPESQVVLIQTQSGERRALISQPGTAQFSPAWSPDGKRIAYAAAGGGQSGIHVVETAEGSADLALSAHEGDHSPQWSPDGSWIAFASDPALGKRALFAPQPDAQAEIYLVRPDGSGLLLLVSGLPFADFCWTAEGDRIVFTQRPDAQTGSTGLNLASVRTDGSQLQGITSVEGAAFSPTAAAGGGLEPRLTLEGVVRTVDGQPLAGVSVRLGDYEPALTGADGRFSFRHLSAGSYALRPVLSGYQFQPSEQQVNLREGADEVTFEAVQADGLFISHIQALQTVDGEGQLTAGKPTVVRVYVDCGEGCTELAGVTGTLRGVSGEGQDLGMLMPEPVSITALHQNWQEQQGDPQRSLNFLLPAEWLNGSVRLTAEVGGTQRETNLSFAPGIRLRLAWFDLGYRPSVGAGTPEPSKATLLPERSAAQQAVRDLWDMLPLAPDGLAYVYQPGIQQSFDSTLDCPALSGGSGCPAVTDYLLTLRLLYERTAREGRWAGGEAPDRLMAWTHPDTQNDGLCSLADTGWSHGDALPSVGRVAVGASTCTFNLKTMEAGQTLTREMGHLLNANGLRPAAANNRLACWWGEPGGTGTLGSWGARVSASGFELFDPAATFDILSYCTPAWVSPATVQAFGTGFTHQDVFLPGVELPGGGRLAADVPRNRRAPVEEQLLTAAVVRQSGQAEILPAFRIASRMPPRVGGETGTCLQVRDAEENVLEQMCQELDYRHPTLGQNIGVDFITASFTADAETAASLVVVRGETELARQTASPNPPVITLQEPVGGEAWADGQTAWVRWKASDADGDVLTYAVSYSQDEGQTWNPMAVGILASELAVDPGRLPGGKPLWLRVSASDGFHSTSAQSVGAVTVADHAPTAVILSPLDGAAASTQGVWLRGYGYDLEDGAMTGERMEWNSNLDGVLGSGPQIFVRLSEGVHDISLTVSDSAGVYRAASVRVDVRQAAAAPAGDTAASSAGEPTPASAPGITLPGLPNLNLNMNTPVLWLVLVGLILLLLVLLLWALIRRGIRRRERQTEVRLEAAAAPERQPEGLEERQPQPVPTPVPEQAPVVTPPPMPAAAPKTEERMAARPPQVMPREYVDEGGLLAQGIQQVKSGNIRQGYAVLRKVLEQQPDNADAWLWLGWAAARQGDRATAQRCFLRAAKLGHAAADQALAWLERQV